MSKHARRSTRPVRRAARVIRGCRSLTVAALLLSVHAWAGEGPIALRVPPPVAPNVVAMPEIANPADAAEQRINAALHRLDESVRKARLACHDGGNDPTRWSRSIDVPMRGPRFLSMVIQDDIYCGGAHPDIGTMAIVYDLRSGRPVDWTTLLPPSLTGTLSLETGADGTRTVRLASKRLSTLFVAHYDHGGGHDADECKGDIADSAGDGPLPLSAWLDAKQGGLMLQPDLPHVIQACGDPVLLPAALLQQEGVSPDLLHALAAAPKQPN